MLFNKYAVSVKRHIREGICIPLDVKPDLVVNVHSVQVVVAVVCNDDLVCMVCKCTAVCHVLLGYIVLLHPCFFYHFSCAVKYIAVRIKFVL